VERRPAIVWIAESSSIVPESQSRATSWKIVRPTAKPRMSLKGAAA
jgi:hypothetical protein